jgi:hypothetical protein
MKGRRLNVGVHTLTNGYVLKYSGVDFSGIPILGVALVPDFLFLPIILIRYGKVWYGTLGMSY